VGSLSYEVYAGLINMSNNGGVARSIQDGLIGTGMTYDSIDQCQIYGGQLWYNTPLNGLRFGVAGGYLPNFGYTINDGTGLYSTRTHAVSNIPFAQASAEYLWKSWTFQAEYYTYTTSGHDYTYLSLPGSNPLVNVSNPANTQKQAWYVNADYQVNSWFQVGSYYCEDYENANEMSNPLDYQKDLALSFRFDPKDWWVFKIEGHYIRGTGLLEDNASNPIQGDNGWFMLAVKTTFSF
jgi:hypothetical protein